MLTLIGIAIVLVAEYVFNQMAMGESTNWLIYYFGSVYFGMTLISADLLFRNVSKSISYAGISFAVFFITLMIIELTFINVPYDEYIINVNDNKLRVINYTLLAIILIYISLMAWDRRRLRK
jgi:hypothetical protein